LVLKPEAAIPPPSIQVFERIVGFSGTLRIYDDDANDPIFDPDDEFVTYRVDGGCTVSPLNRTVTVDTAALITDVLDTDDDSSFEGVCVDDEVTGNVRVVCSLLDDNETVNVSIQAKLKEGTNCDGGGFFLIDASQNAEESEGPKPIPPDCNNCSTHLKAETGGNYTEFTADITNVRGASIGDLPNVQAENLRRLVVTGDVSITDSDWPDPDDTGAFIFSEECLVDPFDREETIHYSQCVDEVRVEVDVECKLALNNTDVDVDILSRLYEGTNCTTDEKEGETERNFVVEACGASCAPHTVDFTVTNDSDKARIRLQVTNLQR
jgi:hypothetical protein